MIPLSLIEATNGNELLAALDNLVTAEAQEWVELADEDDMITTY